LVFEPADRIPAERLVAVGREVPQRPEHSEHAVRGPLREITAEMVEDRHAQIKGLVEVARDYLLLLLFTGMRRGEAAAFRWDDVDFGLRVIRLPAARTFSRAVIARWKVAAPLTSLRPFARRSASARDHGN
jgi:integrase